jgi:ABC-type multidrug transport system fused ATPase/permease subunit
MSFYDSTALGTVLSFFARHLFLIDEFLPEAAIQVLTIAPIVLGSLILISVVIPYFWATLPLYFVLGWIIIYYSQSAIEQLEHFEASTKSPLFAHLSTTLEGLFSIRLYNVEHRFDTYNRTLIDSDHKALYSLLLGIFARSHNSYSENIHGTLH